ncbi:MAG TPA: NAD(P)/FAD-dependent oxidoreductase, partial [Solirubrobacterales bacterium]|nr:NAD(P)/FAD-dependent oxidoreductase [Solirubrobacterales bacterium]
NGDLFRTISEGSVSVATDRIAGFTEGGIKLESGEELEADVIVTATGLNLLFLGGMRLSVDGEEVDPAGRMTYKTMMLSGVPNLAFVIGYTNASWTLKADLAAEYVCRLLSHMDARGQSRCVPELTDAAVTEEPVFNLNSGYIMRSAHLLPKQGSKAPWRLRQIYALDARTLRRGPIDDGALRFSSPAPRIEPLEKVTA